MKKLDTPHRDDFNRLLLVLNRFMNSHALDIGTCPERRLALVPPEILAVVKHSLATEVSCEHEQDAVSATMRSLEKSYLLEHAFVLKLFRNGFQDLKGDHFDARCDACAPYLMLAAFFFRMGRVIRLLV